MPPVCKIVSVICPFLPTHALPREKAGAADFSGEDSEAEEVVGDAGPREGRKWGAGAGWTDAAVMSEPGHRRWPAQR